MPSSQTTPWWRHAEPLILAALLPGLAVAMWRLCHG